MCSNKYARTKKSLQVEEILAIIVRKYYKDRLRQQAWTKAWRVTEKDTFYPIPEREGQFNGCRRKGKV